MRELDALRRRLADIKDRGTRRSERVNRAEKALALATALEVTAAELPDRRKLHAEWAAEHVAVNRAEGELTALAKAALEESHRSRVTIRKLKSLTANDESPRNADSTPTTLDALETRFLDVSTRRAAAQSRLIHSTETRSQVSGGLCPFLLERCRNLRPGVTLDAFFDEETTRWQQLFEQLDVDFTGVDRDLQSARASERERLAAEQLRRERDSIRQDREAAEGRLAEVCRRRDAAASLSAKRADIQKAEQATAVAVREAERATQEVARCLSFEPKSTMPRSSSSSSGLSGSPQTSG